MCLLLWLPWAQPSSTHAQVPEVYRGHPVVAVEIVGEAASLIEPAELGIPDGARLTRRLLRESTERLLASDRWVQVQIDASPAQGGVRLRVRLEPRFILTRIQLNGHEAIDELTLRDVLGVRENQPMSQEDLSDIGARLRKVYAARGYLAAAVSLHLRATDNPGRKVLMVEITEGDATTIRSIRFTGDPPKDPNPVLAAMGFGVGDMLDRDAIESQVEQGAAFLRRKGYLEARVGRPAITVQPQGAIIEVASHVGPRYELRLSGFAPLQEPVVRQALSLDTEPLTRSRLRQGIPDAIGDLFARHGFVDTRVETQRLKGKKPGTAVLRIKITPGKWLEVVAVSFAGAQHFSRDFLRDQLFSYLEEDLPGTGIIDPVDAEVADQLTHGERRTRPRETRRPLPRDPRRIYYSSTYEEAIEHIAELYRAEGYLGVKVGPAKLTRVGKRRATVAIPITEGPRTYLHEVRVRGNDVMTPRELLLAAGLERGQAFSYLTLEEARLRMVDAYHERGYVFVRTQPQVRFSPDRTRASLMLDVVEGYPVRIGRVVVTGVERTDERFVREVLSLSQGDVFRPSLARKSEADLQALGVFSGVRVSLEEPDLPARVKRLVVEVSERKSQYLNFSAGVSTGQGIRGGFEYGYRNLFGRAVELSLRVQLAHQLFFVDRLAERRFKNLTSLNERVERRISLGLVIPRTPGLSDVRTSFDIVHLRDNERDFGLDKNGIGVTFTYLPLRLLTTTLGADLENNNVGLFVGTALSELAPTLDLRQQRLLRVPEGDTTLVALRSSASYDRRDNPFTPKRGFFVSLNGEIARTLTAESVQDGSIVSSFDSQFLKAAVSVSSYLPIGDDIVFANQGRIGRIFHFTSTSQTYPNRAFFLGGVDTMRGYFEDAMVPQDVAEEVVYNPELSQTSIVRAGDAFVLFRSELRLPLYGQLRAGLFVDMGNLWAQAENLAPGNLRHAVGAGLRLATPVGPIAVDYGIILRRRRSIGEPFGTLHFSIGLF